MAVKETLLSLEETTARDIGAVCCNCWVARRALRGCETGPRGPIDRKSSTQLNDRACANVEQSKHIAIGVDIGGTFHRRHPRRRAGRQRLLGQGADHAGAPGAGGADGRCAGARAGQGASRRRRGPSCTARRLATNAIIERKGARTALAHHARLSRCARDRHRASLRPARSVHRVPRAAGAAPPAHRHRRARALRRAAS